MRQAGGFLCCPPEPASAGGLAGGVAFALACNDKAFMVVMATALAQRPADLEPASGRLPGAAWFAPWRLWSAWALGERGGREPKKDSAAPQGGGYDDPAVKIHRVNSAKFRVQARRVDKGIDYLSDDTTLPF
jgi:hypothetical protein